MCVWSAFSTTDKDFHSINSVFVDTDEGRVGVLAGDGSRQVSKLLGEPDHLGSWNRLVLRDKVLILVVVSLRAFTLHTHVVEAEWLKKGLVSLRQG